jgi:oligoribonuclease NrnB/cAMP/cGMP phosphodiesterase (DHH superfamily)
MIIFLYYHRMDLDGYLGGYVLAKHFMEQGYKIVTPKNDFVLEKAVTEAQTKDRKDIVLVRPYNYGDSLEKDIEAITNLKTKGETVGAIFVDCCPYGKEDYFQKLYNLLDEGQYLTVIDHHKTALEFIEKFEKENKTAIRGMRSIDYAACELAWLYLKEFGPLELGTLSHNPYVGSDMVSISESIRQVANNQMPLVLKFAGMYDTFRKDNKWPLVLSFQYGLRTVVPDLLCLDENPDINHLLSETLARDGEVPKNLVNELMTKGTGILDYLKVQNQKLLAQYGHIHEAEFASNQDGGELKRFFSHKCHWVTAYLNNSAVFEDSGVYNDPDMVYMIIAPDLLTGKFKITLYSTPESTIDVSKIAEKMGGGGHFHAAGFEAHKAGITKRVWIDKEKNSRRVQEVLSIFTNFF